jgi:acyl transferase domain-containing protein/acyl carrier protein
MQASILREYMKNNSEVTHRLHSLLDSNVSTFTEQKFIKRLHCEEVFLKEHLVLGGMVLPGAGHLEMARAAAELSLNKPVLSMKDVCWVQSIALQGESTEVAIILRPDNSCVAFEIRDHQAHDVIYSHGKISTESGDQVNQTHRVTYDVDAIRKRNSSRKNKAEIVAHFESIGFKYGSPFQLSDALFSGESEALVALTPWCDSRESNDCQWCPALMDTAIRTAFLIGLEQNSDNRRVRIPFSLGKLEGFASLDNACYAYARVASENADGDHVFNISILDETGAELLLLENLLAKTLEPAGVYKPQPAAVAEDFNEEISRIILRGTEPRPSHAAISHNHSKSNMPAGRGDLFDKVAGYLKKKISAVAKVPATSIATQEPLSSQGIGSAILRDLTRSLEEDFGPLSGTLFFQIGTVEDLAEYFINNHVTRLGKILRDGSYLHVDLPINSVESVKVHSGHSPVRQFSSTGPSVRVGEKQAARDSSCAVAIIGLSGRYPKAGNVEQFWENLKLGIDAVEEIPAARWDYRKYFSPNEKRAGMSKSKWGGFIEDVDKFDASFFSISPREADYMDPQQRLFLEVAWAACEDAGYSWERNRNLDHLPKENNVGVFVALMYDDYHFFERKVSTSYWNSFVANRVSHYFNFRGPSMTVDTACSGSLTGIFMAYESLRNGHCSAAIAGGTNLSIHPTKYARLTQLNMLSGEGRCKSFGIGGSGYVPGEGVGAVLLKRLEDAVRDGDHIYAIIKGGALNHGGKTNGFTVPNPHAQAEVIAAAIENSGVPPRTISYVEAHGTGTKLGDPIEITGLTTAFGKYTADRQFCAIGSVKSNIGHLEAASGIAALTKVVLQMQHQQQVPSLHAKVTNPLIDFQNSPFTLVQELGEWKRPVLEGPDGATEYPRRAGISSFGGGGANAHLILEEYVTNDHDHGQANAVHDGSPVLIPVSAKTQETLKAYVLILQQFCRQRQDVLNLRQMAYTLQTGRQPMDWRAAFLARDTNELCARMEAFLAEKEASGCHHDHVGRGNEIANLFGSDEDLEEAVSKLMAKAKMDKLAQLWVKGLKIDWMKMYGAHRPLRMSLPTYPFARERHWVPNESETSEDKLVADRTVRQAEATRSASAVSPDSALNLLTFREEWKPEALKAVPSESSVKVVYFATEVDRAESLAAAMQSQGLDAVVVRVEQGEKFARLDHDVYQLNSRNKDEYQQLFDSLEVDGFRDYVIVYRWAEGRELAGIHGIYDLLSALGRRPVRRVVLTGLLSDSVASSYDFSWIGFERSLKLIMPGLAFVLLYSKGKPLTDEIIFQEMWGSGIVRHSAGERYRLTIAETTVEGGPGPVLRRNGAYLITGGCGGLGEVFAEHMASKYQARLALLGRSLENDSIRQKLSRLSNLGADAVVYFAADVSDNAALQTAIKAMQTRFGRIDGIIHAAGIGPSLTILDKPWSGFLSVLQPKIAGSIALDEATAGLDMDFICYFSSSSAVLGDFGSCDYSIGNRFQMAFGAYCNGRSEKSHSRSKSVVINWPLWKDGGMTIGDGQQTDMYLKSSGQRYLERQEGLRIWEEILGSDVRQVLVLAGEAPRIKKSLARLYGSKESETGATAHVNQVPGINNAAGKQNGAAKDSMLKSGLAVSIEEQLARDVRARVSEILGLPVERLDDEATWGDFGFDSIGLGDLSKAVSVLFQIEIQPSLFFSYSTIKKFCSYLLREKGALIEARYRQEQELPSPSPQHAESPAAPELPPEPRTMRAAPEQTLGREDMPIAIIGLAGRFPGANNVDELWRNLVSGKNVLTEVPTSRWNWRDYHRGTADAGNKIATNRGGFIDDVSSFDPLFFGISPREADLMEPRQRLLLQEAWHAFEDAGYSTNQLRGSGCGVFIGVEEGDHGFLAKHQGLTPGNHNAMLAARISYYLDLQGPNLAINTACSSGLVALNLACRALRADDCQMAFAGGISLLLSPTAYLMLSNMGMLSPDGQCFPFDQRSLGIVPAEAVAVVVLKPLAKAVEDRDQIYAVIRSSATNYDGRTNGITAPNALSQAALVEKVLTRGGINPAKLQLVMAHSVGSPLGDPIEIQALTQAIRKHSNSRQFCALSSIKSLIGHTFAASGIVNVIAMCLAMKHETIPSTDYNQLNNQLDLPNSPFYLNRSNAVWKKDVPSAPRLGLVGATGMSGTNAFVALEEPPQKDSLYSSRPSNPKHDILVALSAKSPGALEELAGNLAKFLQTQHAIDLADVAYTLQVGREAMTYRALFLVHGIAALISSLQNFVWTGSDGENCFAGEVKKRNRTSLSSEDKTLQKAISAFRNEGKGNMLAQLWAGGADFDWELLYDDVKPRRISLPTYPFIRRPFGILPGTSTQVGNDSIPSVRGPSVSKNPSYPVGATSTKKRICVVGGGPSGLVMAKSLKEEGHDAVVFEKQDTLGGLWALRRNKSAGAYKKTCFQTSKYTSTFSDFFTDDIASTFYNVAEVKSYLDRYAKHFQIEELIQYNSEVCSVSPSGDRWRVVVRQSGVEREDEFDGIALCHGMFWKQQIPAIRGMASFSGETLHSGQYYDNTIFKGKRVLVIGNGVSGMDIAEEASEVAQSVFWSMRSLKLILPRMVGFVPNDCQSVASLLLPPNPIRQLDRLKRSMPEYFRFYERSGLLPSPQDMERNPAILINDNVVRLVAEGKINVCREVESLEGKKCHFTGQTSAEVDVIVFCTGYKYSACDYVAGIQPNDFSMGLFYHRNPTLVNALGMLPVAFFGSFSFSEMAARWYAQLLSGKYQLSQSELQHRIGDADRAVIGPVASALFGLKLGLFPPPEKEFKEFWRLLNYPSFPMIYRLRGEHNNGQARIRLEDYRKKAFVSTDERNPDLRQLKHRILAGLGDQILQRLLASGEITPQDYSGAQLQRENALNLDWNLQYVQHKEPQAQTADSVDYRMSEGLGRQGLQRIVTRVRAADADGCPLVEVFPAETEPSSIAH